VLAAVRQSRQKSWTGNSKLDIFQI
jgi:hypothetical protein